MGLDVVELVLEIEEEFSIKIPDDEAANMHTVGDVFRYIMANRQRSDDPTLCLSAAVFYTLRRAARNLGSCSRLRPRDLTRSLLPATQRQMFWSRLQTASQLKLPELQRHSWVVLLATLLVVTFALMSSALCFLETRSLTLAMGLLPVSAAVWAVVAKQITRPFAVQLPARCETLRGLAETVLALNFHELARKHAGSQPSDVWVALRSIIVQQLGVPPESVTPEASFVKDLGCG